MKIAIIGAGPAGITAAYQLAKDIGKGKVTEVDLFELSSGVGGLAKSFDIWGQRVDLGPHRFFSHDTRVNKLWLEVVEKDYDIVNRQTRIFYNNNFFDYPIKPINALKGLGITEAVRCVLSYGFQRVFPIKNDVTFESWVTNRFGNRLYSIFFKTYSEKLWGIKCNELDSDFASQRIKKMSLYEAIKNAVFGGSKNEHKTLVDQFAFPLRGTGHVYEKMAKKIIKNGGKIHLGIAVEKVITSGRMVKGLELTSGEYKEYDHVISSMPLSQLVIRLPETPYDIKELAHKLKFRNTVLVYLLVNRENLFPDQWLYIHSGELKTGRISNFRNWVKQLYGEEKNTILCMEYWCNFDDPDWQKDDDYFIQLGKEEIIKTGLIGDGEILHGHVVKLPRSYPVYFSNYKEVLTPIENYLKTIEKLHVIGRYGAYKYNNQDHSILMGLLASENILEDKNNDIWGINTDYESYQEASIITKTGLTSMNNN